MFTLKRLSVTMSVLGTMGLVAGACASPTDAEIVGGSTNDGQDVTMDDESAAPGGDTATGSSNLAEDDADSSSSELRPGNDGYYGAARRCRRGNAWHCRQGHYGWRWVNYGGRRCCVRVY